MNISKHYKMLCFVDITVHWHKTGVDFSQEGAKKALSTCTTNSRGSPENKRVNVATHSTHVMDGCNKDSSRRRESLRIVIWTHILRLLVFSWCLRLRVGDWVCIGDLCGGCCENLIFWLSKKWWHVTSMFYVPLISFHYIRFTHRFVLAWRRQGTVCWFLNVVWMLSEWTELKYKWFLGEHH